MSSDELKPGAVGDQTAADSMGNAPMDATKTINNDAIAIVGNAATKWWRIQRFGWIPWLVAITALAAVLRLAFLETVPAGFFFDVAANLFDGLDILAGATPIWFPRNNGREPLMLYATALSMAVVGTGVIAAKLTTAITGILAVPATYLFGREVAAMLPPNRARMVGLFAAFTTATMYWHIHFSRLGLRTIGLSLFLALGCGLILAALRRRSLVIATLGGAAIGLAFYTYTASRLIPVGLLPFLLLALVINRRDPRRIAVVFTIIVTSLLVIFPLGLYYWHNSAQLDQRMADVSVLNPSVGDGEPLMAALRGLYKTAISVSWQGSPSALENLPNRPLFEPLTSIGLLVGSGVLLFVFVRKSDWNTRLRMGFVGTLVAAMMLPPALSVNPPGFVRVSGLVPVLIVIAALGFELIWHSGRQALGRLAPLGLIGLLAIPTSWTLIDYFYNWAPSEVAYRAVMQDKVEAARDVASWLEQGDRVFLAPLYARDLTFMYLLRNKPPETFAIGASIVIPATGRTRYALPVEDSSGATTIVSRLDRESRFDVLSDQTGQYPLLSVITLEPPDNGSLRQSIATFDDGIILDRIELESTSIPAGELLRLTLWWHTEARPSRDYSVFVHGRDANNETRFQRDGMPGNGSVPTSRWQAGDRIGDYHELKIPPDLASGAYRIVLGLYDLGTAQRLAIIDRPESPTEFEASSLEVRR